MSRATCGHSLTVGGAPAVFVPTISDIVQTPGKPGNPRLQDPIPKQSRESNVWAFLEQIYDLFKSRKPRVVETCFQNVIVELTDTVDILTLPGAIGGRAAFYAVGRELLKDQRNGRSRLLQPTDRMKDTTNYLPRAVSRNLP